VEQLDGLIRRRQPLRHGESLLETGDAFRCLYAVRSGGIKACMTTAHGDERILGFYLPGDLVGLDALGSGRHSCSAVALGVTSVCEVPFSPLTRLCAACPRLHQQIHRLIGEAIAQDHASLFLLGSRSAEERLASFLLSLSSRFRRRGFSGREFNLSMTRREIGNYLGLALGTVSRLLTTLCERGVLNVRTRYIRINDIDYLRALVGVPHNTSSIYC
jgi:CRP/FNR family transcriptional regulator